MRKMIVVALFATLGLAACEGGTVSMERVEAAHRGATVAADLARQALEVAKASGADAEKLAAAELAVAKAEALAESWAAKLEEVKESGGQFDLQRLIELAITSAGTILVNNKMRDAARKRRNEPV